MVAADSKSPCLRVEQGLSLSKMMQLLLILLTLITVHAIPEEGASFRDTPPYGADAQALLAAVGAAALCKIIKEAGFRCMRSGGHSGFCSRVALGAVLMSRTA